MRMEPDTEHQGAQPLDTDHQSDRPLDTDHAPITEQHEGVVTRAMAKKLAGDIQELIAEEQLGASSTSLPRPTKKTKLIKLGLAATFLLFSQNFYHKTFWFRLNDSSLNPNTFLGQDARPLDSDHQSARPVDTDHAPSTEQHEGLVTRVMAKKLAEEVHALIVEEQLGASSTSFPRPRKNTKLIKLGN
ncbi:unnamed protein product [Cochlearia groenlandica]